MNKIILLGRLVNDPELKYSESGTATTRFSLAVTRENDRNKADFFFCIAFGKLAEALADHCRKGRQLLIDGRVEINQSHQDGQFKTYVNVIAQGIEFLAKPQTGQQHEQQTDAKKNS